MMQQTDGPNGRRGQAWSRSWNRRLLLMAALVVAYAGLGTFAHLVLKTGVVFTHFGYIAIVLAGMWWGRAAVAVAGLLAGVNLLFHAAGAGAGPLWADLLRAGLFLVVAACVGLLREQVSASHGRERAADEKCRLLVEKSLAAICMYRDDRVLFANARFGEMVAARPEAVVGRSIWDFVRETDRARVKDLVERRRVAGFTDLRYECRLQRADGAVRWADVASSVASYEGAPAVLVTLYDITDRKDMEQMRRELFELARKQEEQLVHSTRLAELGEMAAAVAHELNQPLTGIRNFARNAYYMLEKGIGSAEEAKENLRLISDQVDRASRIINQMRELARHSERQFAPVSLNTVIRESVEFVMPQLRLAGVAVTFDLAADLPPVLGDRIRLEQVFLNLLTNARQAMEASDERRLTVRTRLDGPGDRPADDDERGKPVVAEVADTGVGFEPDQAEKLFRPFFSTKKPGHGTGLGLSISLTIVKDHDGTIEAAGAPGRGATFTVRLPRAPAHCGAPALGGA